MRTPWVYTWNMSGDDKKPKEFSPGYLLIPRIVYKDKDMQLVDWAVFASVYWFEHLRDGKCTAGNGTIAAVIGVEPRSVQNSLTRLEAKGYIARTYKDVAKRNRKEIKTLVDFNVRKLDDTPESERKLDDSDGKSEDRRERKLDDQRDNTKGSNREIVNATQSVAGKEINDLIDLFKEVNPSFERLFRNTTQRAALERLVKKHGRDLIERAIRFLSVSNGQPYAPTITTPVVLEAKLGDLIAWGKKQKARGPKAIVL